MIYIPPRKRRCEAEKTPEKMPGSSSAKRGLVKIQLRNPAKLSIMIWVSEKENK